jgi:hypothetical protein
LRAINSRIINTKRELYLLKKIRIFLIEK